MSAAVSDTLAPKAAEYAAALALCTRRITICAGTGCISAGAKKVQAAIAAEAARAGLAIKVELKAEDRAEGMLLGHSGCQGFCQQGPLVSIEPDGILYCKVKPEDAAEIVAETLVANRPVARLLFRDGVGGTHRGHADIPFYAKQDRLILAECGSLDPDDLRAYLHAGGYLQARKAWQSLRPEELCRTIEASGLRGRGGGGFPTGRKWEACRRQPGPGKFVICNADEGDPGAFMNRSVMEGSPHSVIEGMMIAAHAVGADQGWIYVRTEYPLAVERVRRAVAQAEAAGILGADVLGTGRALRIRVMEGAGAFVCGEETALLQSIEGRRGMPRPKPPFPAESGLWGRPTVINNVETLAAAVLVLRLGPEAYRQRGTKGSPGTKTFALTGNVVNTGLIEVPFGATLRQIIFEIGGGILERGQVLGEEGFKALQIGGPSGGCLTREHLDLPLDYDSLRGVGAMIGSGGMVVMSRSTCMVEVARFFMSFTQEESCGKCVPCREGTRQMLALLTDIVEGRGDEETLRLLEELARTVQTASLCGLGRTASNPVLSTLRYFRDEYLAHVVDKRCPTRQCKALSPPVVDGIRCKGCGLCIKACPVGAISGEKRKPHAINPDTCVRCGACLSACKLAAIH